MPQLDVRAAALGVVEAQPHLLEKDWFHAHDLHRSGDSFEADLNLFGKRDQSLPLGADAFVAMDFN